MKPLFFYWVISRILQQDFRRWAYEPIKPILVGSHKHVWFRRWIPKPDPEPETYDSLTRRIYEQNSDFLAWVASSFEDKPK